MAGIWGKGKVTAKLSLSNAGLHGDGTLDYLTSVSKTDDFLFLPDSMNSNVKSFTNRNETLGGSSTPL